MYSAQTDGGSRSVEQTGNRNKSTRVLIPDQTGCCYLCATAQLPPKREKSSHQEPSDWKYSGSSHGSRRDL